MLATSPAGAEIAVYAGTPASAFPLPEGASSVDVFISSGPNPSSSGTPCVNGNGDELCGWSVRLEATGGVALLGFTPGTTGQTVWSLSGNVLLANGGNSEEGRLSPEKIGTLDVEVADLGSIEVVAGGSSVGVGADLGLESVPRSVIALPEPDQYLMLGAGAALLFVVGHRRMAARE